jgi:hypothetical protein
MKAGAIAGDCTVLDAKGDLFECCIEHLGVQVTVSFLQDVDGAYVGKPDTMAKSVGCCPATQLKAGDELAEGAPRLDHKCTPRLPLPPISALIGGL